MVVVRATSIWGNLLCSGAAHSRHTTADHLYWGVTDRAVGLVRWPILPYGHAISPKVHALGEGVLVPNPLTPISLARGDGAGRAGGACVEH